MFPILRDTHEEHALCNSSHLIRRTTVELTLVMSVDTHQNAG